MAENPRGNVKSKGFWDGGPKGQGTNKESGGKASGAPRTPATRTGFRVDLEFPESTESEEPKS